MKHIMLDLETLGTGYKAAIVSIGAVEFDPFAADVTSVGFYRTINVQSAIDAGLSIKGDTILWWMQQSEAARQSTFVADAAPLGDVLFAFSNYADALSGGDQRELAVWGNGATFDNVIIRSAFEAVRLPVPWRYNNDKCYRTVVNLLPKLLRPKYPDHGTKHNALDDAIAQAKYLQLVLKELEIEAV